MSVRNATNYGKMQLSKSTIVRIGYMLTSENGLPCTYVGYIHMVIKRINCTPIKTLMPNREPMSVPGTITSLCNNAICCGKNLPIIKIDYADSNIICSAFVMSPLFSAYRVPCH